LAVAVVVPTPRGGTSAWDFGAHMNLPDTVEQTHALLAGGRYVADRSCATSVFLALKLGRPLFLEGEAGVGKTEIA
jgi:MoxR-like ATPase